MRQKAKTPDRKTEQIVLGPPEAFPDLRGSARERARFELARRLGETGLASTGTPTTSDPAAWTSVKQWSTLSASNADRRDAPPTPAAGREGVVA